MKQRDGRRTPSALWRRLQRDVATLHIVSLDVLHEVYSRKGHCDRAYLGMLLSDMVRAGRLKRIRRGEYLVNHEWKGPAVILKPDYRHAKETDLIPNRTVFRIFDGEGKNVAVAWTEADAMGIAAALNAADMATRLKIENAELKDQLARLLLS